jgi:fatty acid desaturase
MSLLFLNNNFHHAHHARPGLAWYRLAEAHASSDCEAEVIAGAGLYRSYGEIARRFLFRPVWSPVHPGRRVEA